MQKFELHKQITIAALRDLRLSLVKREISPNQPENQSQSCQPNALHFPLKSDGIVYDLGIILARGLDQMLDLMSGALAIWAILFYQTDT